MHQGIRRQHSKFWLLSTLAALGAGIAYLFKSKKGKEWREAMADKMHYAKERMQMSKEEVEDRVKNIFGEMSEELERLYLNAKADIRSALSRIKDKSELTKERYNAIVDEVTETYSQDKKYNRGMLARLKKSLQDEWERIKER